MTPFGRLRMMTFMTESLVSTDSELPLITRDQELVLVMSGLAGGFSPQVQRSAAASVPARRRV